jgi:hypothetical protein
MTNYQSLKTYARHRAAANTILDHIHNGDLQDGFTFQDVHRPQWPNLTNRKWVRGGLDLLCGLDWLKTFKKPVIRGPRPIAYYVCLEVRDLPKRRLGCEISICQTFI